MIYGFAEPIFHFLKKMKNCPSIGTLLRNILVFLLIGKLQSISLSIKIEIISL